MAEKSLNFLKLPNENSQKSYKVFLVVSVANFVYFQCIKISNLFENCQSVAVFPD